MTGLSVDADISASVDLLGKHVTDLQSDLAISDEGAITGTLAYLDDYTGFSGDPAEQVGNFMALHCEVEDDPDATITVELVGGVHGPVTLDEDGIIILLIRSTEQSVKVTASKEGFDDTTQTFDLSGLTLTPSTP